MPLLTSALREQRYSTFRKMFKTHRGISYIYLCVHLLDIHCIAPCVVCPVAARIKGPCDQHVMFASNKLRTLSPSIWK